MNDKDDSQRLGLIWKVAIMPEGKCSINMRNAMFVVHNTCSTLTKLLAQAVWRSPSCTGLGKLEIAQIPTGGTER